MKSCLDHNLRGGKVIEIESLLDDIQLEYVDCLKESISVYTTYDEVSSETFNDSLNCKAKVEMLFTLAYIDQEECEAICKKIQDIRLDALNKLDEEIQKGNKKDGEKNK